MSGKPSWSQKFMILKYKNITLAFLSGSCSTSFGFAVRCRANLPDHRNVWFSNIKPLLWLSLVGALLPHSASLWDAAQTFLITEMYGFQYKTITLAFLSGGRSTSIRFAVRCRANFLITECVVFKYKVSLWLSLVGAVLPHFGSRWDAAQTFLITEIYGFHF